MTCESCGNKCDGEFGDLEGHIFCPNCLGWYGSERSPEVQELQDLQDAIDLGDRETLEDAFGCDFPHLA